MCLITGLGCGCLVASIFWPHLSPPSPSTYPRPGLLPRLWATTFSPKPGSQFCSPLSLNWFQKTPGTKLLPTIPYRESYYPELSLTDKNFTSNTPWHGKLLTEHSLTVLAFIWNTPWKKKLLDIYSWHRKFYLEHSLAAWQRKLLPETPSGRESFYLEYSLKKCTINGFLSWQRKLFPKTEHSLTDKDII